MTTDNKDLTRLFEITPDEEKELRQFLNEVKSLGVTDPDQLLIPNSEIDKKSRKFISEHKMLVSKIIRNVNKNSDYIEQHDPKIYQFLVNKYGIKPNQKYYVPPMSVPDPMDATEVLPMIGVVVVAAALMFVGRGALRGVV